MRAKVKAGEYLPPVNSKVLEDDSAPISEEWPEPPPARYLHVFVRKPVLPNMRNITAEEPKLDIESIDKKVDNELDLIRGEVESFLKNPKLPIWEPPDFATPSNQKFLRNLRIPCYPNGDPSLLFHNLDTWKDDKDRISKIFESGAHQYVVI